MIILAIETSCDDTSLAIFENENLLAMDTKSQIKIHNETGGVVPEIAAREHANVIFEVLENVLNLSKKSLKEIDYIAVTTNPGLIPSLLTGITLAKTLGCVLQIPVIEINHIQAHIFANFLERKTSDIEFPLVCLTVSGGHNDIYFMENMWSLEKIGTSNDDAAGESFDKVAKMMGLGYPGGPIIGEYASKFLNNSENIFPRVWLKKDLFDFSFSGLKSAVKREIEIRIEKNENILSQNIQNDFLEELKELKKLGKILLTKNDIIEISFEFQNSVNEVLSYKLINAGLEKQTKYIMLAGGVSANDDLREKILSLANKNNLNFLHPTKKIYCMDNAAMVGILAYYKIVCEKV